MTDALGGNIPLVYTAVAGAQAHVKAGKLIGDRGVERPALRSLPDVPTFIESGVRRFRSRLVGRHSARRPRRRSRSSTS